MSDEATKQSEPDQAQPAGDGSDPTGDEGSEPTSVQRTEFQVEDEELA